MKHLPFLLAFQRNSYRKYQSRSLPYLQRSSKVAPSFASSLSVCLVA
jgi:hypothetical protein